MNSPMDTKEPKKKENKKKTVTKEVFINFCAILPHLV